MRFIRSQLSARYFIAICTLAFLTGCVPSAEVAQFSASCTAVRQQTDTAFSNINELIEQDQISRVVKNGSVKEEDVSPVLSAKTRARYDLVFDQLQSYTNNLASLVSTDRPKDFEDSMQQLGNSLSQVDRNAMPSPEVSTAIEELGSLIIRAKAQSDALHIAQVTDPAVQRVCQKMAEAISSPKPVSTAARAAAVAAGTPANDIDAVIDVGIRQNVADHWQDRINHAALEFKDLAAKGASDADKEASVKQYISLLQQRDADLMALDSLRQSYVQLGIAHAALARGERINLATALDSIKTEIQATRDLFDKMKRAKNSKNAGDNNG